jgi:hypothetical protein
MYAHHNKLQQNAKLHDIAKPKPKDTASDSALKNNVTRSLRALATRLSETPSAANHYGHTLQSTDPRGL